MPFNKSLKSIEQERAYREFMLKLDVVSFRIACLYGSVHIFLFAIIDYWRATHYQYVFISRFAMILALISATGITYRVKLTVRQYDILAIFTSFFIVVASFFMDLFSGIPPFFLPNFLCLLLYVYNAGLGYSLRTKIIQSIIFFAAFSVYAFYISPHSEIQISQSFNVLVNALVSILIGYLIERYKRINFDQMEMIENLSDFKTKLISVLSHDLSSPLNTLKGLLQLKGMGALRQEELDVHSSKVQRSLENVSGMLQNLVKWSGSQLNGFELTKENIDVGKTIDEVIELLENSATKKGIRIEKKIENNVHLIIDQEILKIVMRNFISNAVKFSKPGSSISILTNSEPNSLTISVQDTGIGMSQDDIDNLFQMSKVSGVGTENERGSGIGLIITKEFVEMMHGTISVTSKLGKGSIFSATFPIGN